MSNRYRFTALLFATVLTAGAAIAQEVAKPAVKAKFYRLDFVVKEVEEGKALNARSYFAIMSSANGATPVSIRTGSRVAVPSGGPGSSSFNFLDVGVSIDCRPATMLDAAQAEAQEAQGLLSLSVTADISSLAPPAEGVPNAPPVMRNNRWSSSVILPLKKPTTIFSSDDATSKRKLQMELTATPI
jgi:hypothetical protein